MFDRRFHHTTCKQATSGINGAESAHQQAQGIEDSVGLFADDTLRSGRGKSDKGLVEVGGVCVCVCAGMAGGATRLVHPNDRTNECKRTHQILTAHSAGALAWLEAKAESAGASLDLSSITQLGGHRSVCGGDTGAVYGSEKKEKGGGEDQSIVGACRACWGGRNDGRKVDPFDCFVLGPTAMQYD